MSEVLVLKHEKKTRDDDILMTGNACTVMREHMYEQRVGKPELLALNLL